MSDDLAETVYADFGARAADALELLACYGSVPPTLGDVRVHQAIVSLAHGDIDELSRMVDAALTDCRDVLMWAQEPGSDYENGAPTDLAEWLRDGNGGLPPNMNTT